MPSLLSSIRRNVYHDSVKLMRVSEELSRLPGVMRAAVVMATPLNVGLLAADGLIAPDTEATAEDLLVTVLAEDEIAGERALARLDQLLQARSTGDEAGSTEFETAWPARTIEAAARRVGGNLAVIAVPGPSATLEALAALRSGMHVFLFSDNVPLEAEVRLKGLAAELDLLMMGPDCGTAILGGIGLGFANRVRSGPVGIVGASGTGIQQVCCLLDAAGIGIAEAIGTGGRDLSAAVGGSMTIRAARALDADDRVEIIAVVSKLADEEVARRLHRELLSLSKPVVICLVGETSVAWSSEAEGNVQYVPTLTALANAIQGHITGTSQSETTQTGRVRETHAREGPSYVGGEAKHAHNAEGGMVYGLFAGGTLCSEAAIVLDAEGVRHHLVDLGDDEYTRGRAHPIIDPRLRASMLADLGDRPDLGAVLFDVILGDLAHPDPAAALLPSIVELRERAGRQVPVVVTLIGTVADPQGLWKQRDAFLDAGVAVYASNVAAAQAAARSLEVGT